MALAYDVAIGLCYLTEDDFENARIQADWRFASDAAKGDPNSNLADYIKTGKYGDLFLHEWAKKDEHAKMPPKIYDERDGGFFLKLGGRL